MTKRVSELFDDFCRRSRSDSQRSEKLRFEGVPGMDVYNATAPFRSAGRTVIAGRVERRDEEFSNIVFFEKSGNVWRRIEQAPTFELQDPFVTRVQGQLVLGGVEIAEVGGKLEWKTRFFRGSDILDLESFFDGPTGMKDIRLCDLGQGKIGLFTRPQGEVGGRGKIAYTEVTGLDDLTIERIESAQLIRDMTHDQDWAGANETHLLADGRIGVLAHVSCFEDDDIANALHYYAASFIFNPNTRDYSNFGIIACRSQFKDGPSKREELRDVIFPSGLVFDKGAARLYAGVSDAETHWLEIENPFADLG